MTERESTDRARALCHEIEAHVGRMDPRREWAAARHTAGIALVAAALRDAHAAGVRAGQERMRERAAETVRAHRESIPKDRFVWRMTIDEAADLVRALPLEEK